MPHRVRMVDAIAALPSGATGKTPSVDTATTSSAPNAHPEDRAERRQVTVMFSDLVGSTALSACMDHEDLREVISAYQKCVAEAVGRFGGSVAKYMGDGVPVGDAVILMQSQHFYIRSGPTAKPGLAFKVARSDKTFLRSLNLAEMASVDGPRFLSALRASIASLSALLDFATVFRASSIGFAFKITLSMVFSEENSVPELFMTASHFLTAGWFASRPMNVKANRSVLRCANKLSIFVVRPCRCNPLKKAVPVCHRRAAIALAGQRRPAHPPPPGRAGRRVGTPGGAPAPAAGAGSRR
jgi:hypothetical protein